MLTGYSLRALADGAAQVHETTLRLAAGAAAELCEVSSGGGICRVHTRVRLSGERSKVELASLGLVGKGMQLDNQVDVIHEAPGTVSRQLFKQLVFDHGRSAFEGHIHVKRGAPGTDAYQLSRTMLLDGTGQFVARPQLYIDNADVKCSHGAATGRIREEELSYLQSRGLAAAEATRMLCRAFAGEITTKIADPPTQARAQRMLEVALPKR